MIFFPTELHWGFYKWWSYKFYALLLTNFLSLSRDGTSEMFNPPRASLDDWKDTKAFVLLGSNMYHWNTKENYGRRIINSVWLNINYLHNYGEKTLLTTKWRFWTFPQDSRGRTNRLIFGRLETDDFSQTICPSISNYCKLNWKSHWLEI